LFSAHVQMSIDVRRGSGKTVEFVSK